MQDKMRFKVRAQIVNVGQASCNIIVLPTGRVIIFDIGGSGAQIVKSLHELNATGIHSIIISHLHDDHYISLMDVVKYCFSSKLSIGSIAFPSQGFRTHKLSTEWLADIQSEAIRTNSKEPVYEIGYLDRNQKCRVTSVSNSNRSYVLSIDILHPDSKHSNYFMRKYFEWRDYLAMRMGKHDRKHSASAIMSVSCGNNKIILGSDANIKAWLYLHKKLKEKRIKCRIVVCPHHGGRIAGGKKEISSCHLLYSKILHADFAAISVGYGNSYGHPCNETMNEMMSQGTVPICTQVTEKCIGGLEIATSSVIEYVLREKGRYDRNSRIPLNLLGKSCAGNINLKMDDVAFEIIDHDIHQESIDHLYRRTEATPLCRNAKRR